VSDLAGTWFVLPTAFDEHGALDLTSQRSLVEAAIDWQVDGLTVMGVMSEVSSLSDAERDAALEAIFAAAGARVPIAVGCSAAGPHLVRQRIAAAADLGAVAAMVSAPPLLRNVDLLPRFYAAVAGTLPVVVQDEPAATGVLVPTSILLACLAAADSRVIKLEDPPTPPKISALLSADPALQVFGGLGGVAALTELSRGACGTMTGFAFPEVLRAVREALEAKDVAQAAAVFDRFLPLIQFEGQPVAGLAIRKEVLRLRGAIATSTTRGISAHLDAISRDELLSVLTRVGVEPGRSRLEVHR
jgi:4-hydroxy-tetrahydrodipicolinate synthase